METSPTPNEAGADRLLEELRRLSVHDPRTVPQALIDWLDAETGARVAWLDGHGRIVLSSPGFPPGALDPVRPVLAQLAAGRMAAAVARSGTLQVRCEAHGSGPLRPVLVVAGPVLSRSAAALVSHAVPLLAALVAARAAETASRGYREKAGRLRLAVFMALMSGDPTLARRMTVGAAPPLLDADRLRVRLLACAPADRTRLTDRYQDAAGYHGRNLLVRCPVYDDHLICLTAEGTGRSSRLAGELRRLVDDNPGYALGISDPHPPAETAAAYEQARHALAVARGMPGRVAAYRGQAPLERFLPREPALAWATEFLGPVSDVPKLTIDVTRLALTFSNSGVARLLGISRNTVTAHLKRIEEALGLSQKSVLARATLALALSITGPQHPTPPYPGAAGRRDAPGLDELLRTPAATAWAGAVLSDLDDPAGRDLRGTLRAWIETDANAQRTGHRLGISRSTVAARLRAAERLLNRDLLTTGAGVHDVVHALRISGDLASPG
ncbi:helix-turn-helix domain-containing protein [Streptomyces sp. MP131-18]|uniref:helix-turn-helix domain-containing protein n=1 Tax=Streptomyces sp. MP131-18 TaxID=1857892 RepID=UPI00097BD83B|nr:helix-turn-helix domain-containing protein [Streptomyces sp. MP131-18]ONK14787.1 Sugar diacid utilization regulator [Streptomyces sp. MP131-18]